VNCRCVRGPARYNARRLAKFDTDKWVAISAMVVSVGTLIALSYQSLLMRESECASTLPYLYFSLVSNSQQGVEILPSNSGIGPAIVDDVQFTTRAATSPPTRTTSSGD
jgi:hypothetical protein